MSSPLGIPGVQQPDEIGRGGFGTVYRADEPEFSRAIAVKIIQDRVDDDEVRRAFVRECQAMGRLSGHPHIVTVHRGGTTDLGEPYIVMDLMDGGSLADRLSREGPLPWPEVLEIGVAVAGALETAHRAGILHLDVKPANVLVSRYGEPKLADFGISRLPGVTATTDGRVRASIAYAAPERLLDGTATPSSDLYALGSTMYTLLVGEPAFVTKSGEDLLVAISRIVRQPVPDLRMHGVPDPVVPVIERLLAKSPVDRFTTAAEAAAALQAAQRATGQPVTRAVVEGAPAARGGPRTSAIRRPALLDPNAATEIDPPLTRPRYVPRSRPDRGPGATDLIAAIPTPRTSARSAAAVTAPIAPHPLTARGRLPEPRIDSTPADSTPAHSTRADSTRADSTPAHSTPAHSTRADSTPAHSTLIDVAPPTEATPAAGPTGDDGSRPPRSIRRPLAVATAVAAVLSLTVAGSQLLTGPAGPPPVPPSPTAGSSPTPAPTTAAPPLQIAVADDVSYPGRDAVAARLDGYFRDLNERDYDAAFAAFSPDSTVAGNGLAAFREGNSTTEVRRQRIVAIEDLAGDRVQATVTYRSTQDAGFGPNGETCTNWRLAYELTGPQLLIRKARAVTKPQPC